ncbi:MAG: DUF5615 family PIN-like protein [Thermomicrobiales bacterium]
MLFDQNLSFKLVRNLSDLYQDSVHVRYLQFAEADDLSIWHNAAVHDLIIVSKDSDFHQMSLLYGHPPKTVWLRVGNASTATIEALLRDHRETIEHFYEDRDAAFLALA